MSNRRGGARPRAGAPKGNRNGVRSGKYVADPEIRRAFIHAEQALPAEDFAALLRGYKASAVESIKQPVIDQTAANVIPMRRPSISTASSPTTQSNPYDQVVRRMEQYGFRDAKDFVRRHLGYLSAIENVLDYLDNMEPSQYPRIKNAGGLIRDDIHREISVPQGALLRCPACGWSEGLMAREDSGS